MHLGYLLVSLLLLSACGGRSMNKGMARDLIMQIPGEALEKKDIEVVNISQVSGSEAVAETSFKTAFRLEKVHGTWVVREVRIGHGQWEKVSNLVKALERVKIEETGEMLDSTAEGIRKYQADKGFLPGFKSYIDLSDLLTPKYLTPLIRLDAWRRPFQAERMPTSAIAVRSAGPDGLFYTNDDIVRTVAGSQ